MRRAMLTITLLLALAGCEDASPSPDDGGDVDGDSGNCSAPMTDCPPDGCVNTSSSVDHCGACDNACGGCDRCIMGLCTLACCPGTVDCDPSRDRLDCVETDYNRERCGNCDTTCADDEICYRGDCLRCEPPQTRCGNSCADLTRDRQNCGDCGNVCLNSYCQCGECVAELSDGGCP